MGPCVFRKDNSATTLVEQRRLLGDEIHPVHQGVHEQDVELLVRRDREREVISDAQVDRGPAVLLKTIVDSPRFAMDLAQVLRVLGNLLTRGIEQREHADSAVHFGMRPEVELEGAEPTNDVLGRVGPVDAQHELLRTRLHELAFRGADRRAGRELFELCRIDGDRCRERSHVRIRSDDVA